ncbi:MAG: hypothetical protein IT564_08670 [Rhodospirillales bacterium]|nr:hypothetical protein [Rhodospirillales bacterium]
MNPPMPNVKPPLAGIILFLSAILLGACEQTSAITPTTAPMSGDAGSAPGLPQFNDVLVPPGAKLYVERTMILGENPWYGQLTLGVSGDPPALFDQYRRDMPGLGWQEVTSIRATVSTLTFMRDDRVATVQIQASRLRGSEVVITVSPRGTGSATTGGGSTMGRAPGGGGGQASPIRPAPVQRQ